MSAAEKLKALDAHGFPVVTDYGLRRALPQIVAVVEAAERAVLVSACDYPEGACENECGRGGDNFDARIDCVRIQALQALDALDEVLP